MFVILQMRERQKRPIKKGRGRASVGSVDLEGIVGYSSLGFDPSQWFRSAAQQPDYIMMDQKTEGQQPRKEFGGGTVAGTEEFGNVDSSDCIAVNGVVSIGIYCLTGATV